MNVPNLKEKKKKKNKALMTFLFRQLLYILKNNGSESPSPMTPVPREMWKGLDAADRRNADLIDGILHGHET